MRKQIAIFIVCLMFPLGNARADDTDLCKNTFGEIIKEKDECIGTDGCEWVSDGGGRCEKCSAGYYGMGGECWQCDSPWLNSEAGSTSETDCFTACTTGDKIDGKEHAYQVATQPTAYRPKHCEYTLGCDSDITKNSNNIAITNLCNSYFAYPNNSLTSSCRPRWLYVETQWDDQKTPAQIDSADPCDTGATKKYYLNMDNSTTHFKCYALECGETFILDKTQTLPYGFICNPNSESLTLGQCKKETISCATNLTTSCQKHFQSSNTAVVTGDATWDSNKNDYDYSNCKCSDTSKLTDENGQEIGKATLECNYSAGQWQNCISTGLHSCIAGYCDSDNTQTCKKAPAGTYSGAGDKNCTKCPAGMTSESGSTDASKCGIRRGNSGTKFCDRVGCFTLPGNGFIYGYTN